MLRQPVKDILVLLGVAGFYLLFSWTEAQAVPSFARQTGMSCTSCHTVFPELTPFGRTFKLTGYTFSNNTAPVQLTPPPVTAEAQISFTNLHNTLPPQATYLGIRGNDNINFPQSLNFYYAGQVVGKAGAFVQVNYGDLNRHIILSKADARYADTFSVGGRDLILGLTYNNYPTLQDVYNTTPAWSFPYLRSFVAPGPAQTLLEGGLATQAGGVGRYGLFHNLLYAEISLYRTAANGFTQPLSAGVVDYHVCERAGPVLAGGPAACAAAALLFRGHLRHGDHVFFGRNTARPTSYFIDLGFDAQYQYITPKHVFSAQANWIYESQNLTDSYILNRASGTMEFLSSFKINANYHYRSPCGTVGGTIQYFAINGSSDPLRYGSYPVYGSRNGSPNSNGVMLQGDYLPLDRIKISVQYTIYTKFNGGGTDYDGNGRNATDNNTLFYFRGSSFDRARCLMPGVINLCAWVKISPCCHSEPPEAAKNPIIIGTPEPHRLRLRVTEGRVSWAIIRHDARH